MLAALQEADGLADIADIVARYARIALGADGASVTEIRDDHYVYVATTGAAVPPPGTRRPLANSFTGKVVAERQARFFLREQEPDSRDRAAEDRIMTGIVVPVVVDDAVVGTVGVTSGGSVAFGARHLDALAGFAEHLAIGLTLRGLYGG